MWSNFVETSTGTGPFQHHSEYCWYWWCELRWRHVDFIYFYFISYHIPTHKICPELQNSIASGLAKVAAYDFLSLGLIVSIWYFLTIVYKPREGVTKKGNKTLFRTVYINIYNARVELSYFHIRYAGQNAINHRREKRESTTCRNKQSNNKACWQMNNSVLQNCNHQAETKQHR